jgi:hypothetical protein
MIGRTERHPEEADLVLHFYGDSGETAAIDRHLADCPACAASFTSIANTLTAVPDAEIPERGELYGLEVWQRIRPVLPVRTPWWSFFLQYRRAAAASIVAAALTVAFVAGRYLPTAPGPAMAPAPQVAVAGDAADATRARWAATADHLEQSERVLLDLANADGRTTDVSLQQAWAADLIDANRLFREAAVQAGDNNVAGLLDDLERSLLDIVHAPSTLTPAQLDDVRARLDAAALVFKLRILSNELRERETAPTAPRKTT